MVPWFSVGSWFPCVLGMGGASGAPAGLGFLIGHRPSTKVQPHLSHDFSNDLAL